MAAPARVARAAARAGHFGVVAAFVVFCAFPFYWMLITTFKQTGDLMNRQGNPWIYNQPPTL